MMLQQLPEELGAAVSREIDPDETVRWVGQPAPWAFVLRMGIPGVILGLFCLGFGVLLMYPAWETWREVRGMEGHAGKQPTIGSAYVMVAIAAVLIAGGTAGLVAPWRAARRARRTVYAVTNTRVLQVTVAKSGAVKAAAVEPSHPLSISRNESSPGVGDVHLYPSGVQGRPAMMSLLGVKEPREVERVIRRTFDPAPRDELPTGDQR